MDEADWKKKNAAAIVYEIREKSGERFYVGMTCFSLRARVGQHFTPSNRNSPFSGLDKNNWTWTILEVCESESEARQGS